MMRRLAVVIDHPLAPGAAEREIRPARQDDRILDWDDALIVVAVQRPGLQLAASEAAFVHHEMEGMAMMIAFYAHGAELGAEFVEREQARVVGRAGRAVRRFRRF